MADRSNKPKPLTVSRSQRDAVTVVSLAGDLDGQNLEGAKTALGELLEGGARAILFDLEKVNYIDSSGLGFFIGSLKRIRELGGEMKLCRLNAYMLGIFRLIHLDYVLELFEDPDKAMASFKKVSKPKKPAPGR